MALDTSAESPVPVRTVLQLVGGWIGKLGRVWVEREADREVAFDRYRRLVADVVASSSR